MAGDRLPQYGVLRVGVHERAVLHGERLHDAEFLELQQRVLVDARLRLIHHSAMPRAVSAASVLRTRYCTISRHTGSRARRSRIAVALPDGGLAFNVACERSTNEANAAPPTLQAL